jgi:hypothetical protein
MGTASSTPRCTYLGRTVRRRSVPAQEARWLVVEPFVDFLADAPPVLRRDLHRLGHDHLLDDGKMLGQPRLPSFTRRRCCRRAPWCLRCHGLRGFSLRVEALQHEQQLLAIQFLALSTEEPPDQCLHLFAQQLVLRPQLRQFIADTCIFRRRQSELFAQLFLAWRLFGHRAYSTTAPFKRSLIFAPVC